MKRLLLNARVAGIAVAVIAARVNAAGPIGADLPWTTYEAETMRTSGRVLGPGYQPYQIETESSGVRCVQLKDGDTLEFTVDADANALVVRYSVPDADQGGPEASLVLEVNGRAVRTLTLTAKYSHLYGAYPFSNDPAAGKHRNYYDEVRVKGVAIGKGSVVRLRKAAGGASSCVVDLVDLERVPPPLAAPPSALSVLEFGAHADGASDCTAALRACIAAAAKSGRAVWVPPGDYRLTGDIVLPSGVTLQGAGMWHTTFVGDDALYARPERRVRFKLVGSRIRLADFAIVGRLNYRNDNEPNDGLVGAGCSESAVERVWVEHTKVGVWLYNGDHVRIEGCRFRNLLADGLNLCVGAADNLVENCTARGTGDDCFAIWPAPADQGFEQAHRPGNNVIRRCTGQLPFLANGAAVYGGAGNRVEDCRFTDITPGCGVLISTTFPTSDPARNIDNNFSGTTVVQNCELVRCGGYDHDWAWRAALQICLHHRSISGLAIRDVVIRSSLSDAVAVLAAPDAAAEGRLTSAELERVRVDQVGLGTPGRGLRISANAHGALRVTDSSLGEIQNDAKDFLVQSATSSQEPRHPPGL